MEVIFDKTKYKKRKKSEHIHSHYTNKLPMPQTVQEHALEKR